jgi:plastocyanin
MCMTITCRQPTLAALLLGFMVLAGCNTEGPAYNLPSPIYSQVIDMTSLLSFSPEQATIKIGDTVLWRNKTLLSHTVTADPQKVDDPADVSLPPGAQPFASGDIEPGEVFAYRFKTAGTYHYVCRTHEGMNMHGTIVVTE